MILYSLFTCIIATRRTSPCKPTAMDPMAMAAGPAMNLSTMPNAVKPGPQAIIFFCNAMKRPGSRSAGPSDREFS